MLQSSILGEDHELFRRSVRAFFENRVEPNIAAWEAEHRVPRTLWLEAGEMGFLCPSIPEAYGGAGGDFLYNVVVAEETGYAIGGGSVTFTMHSDVVAFYILNHGTEPIKQRWLPWMVSGEACSAIAMSEPGAGSDLKAIQTRAVPTDDGYILNGGKTFITNGLDADVYVVACKTDPAAGAKGVSLLVVEADRAGFSRGKRLEKIGQKAAGTCELFFQDVFIPRENLLGAEGQGFAIMMDELPRERLNIAVRAFSSALRGFQLAVAYVKERKTFGKAVIDFQTARHALAEIKTELAVARSMLDRCLVRLADGVLTAEDAAMAKLWISEMEWRTLDRCLQLHGGYGYMMEYPIARLFIDARSRRIYGGSSEIMRDYVGRFL
jgi:long-chain-acyl-CoA dehydrogenase